MLTDSMLMLFFSSQPVNESETQQKYDENSHAPSQATTQNFAQIQKIQHKAKSQKFNTKCNGMFSVYFFLLSNCNICVCLRVISGTIQTE